MKGISHREIYRRRIDSIKLTTYLLVCSLHLGKQNCLNSIGTRLSVFRLNVQRWYTPSSLVGMVSTQSNLASRTKVVSREYVYWNALLYTRFYKKHFYKKQWSKLNFLGMSFKILPKMYRPQFAFHLKVNIYRMPKRRFYTF